MKVLVVDDNPIIRSGLTSKLESIEMVKGVGQASDALEALDMLQATHYDLVFLDIKMPKMDGLTALTHIKDTPVVMLTSFADEEMMRKALALGARGYLTYGSFTNSELMSALLMAPKGGIILGSTAASLIDFSKLLTKSPVRSLKEKYNISARESEILDALTKGYSNDQIAKELQVSKKTVKSHLYNAYAKLGVQSRLEAVALWLGVKEAPL
ncbi:MAG: response regulator transcription factor [Propionibacteriaceae bacterium]|nr:response regulator transcription factor [Propionibacteriaceae bacterium]